MTKTELIDAIASGVDGLTKAKAEQALNVTLAAIMESVGKGDAVSLIGFGTFSQGRRGIRGRACHKALRQEQKTSISEAVSLHQKHGNSTRAATHAPPMWITDVDNACG